MRPATLTPQTSAAARDVQATVAAIARTVVLPEKEKRGGTKGGEALLTTIDESGIGSLSSTSRPTCRATVESPLDSTSQSWVGDPSPRTAPWYALWTHSHREQLVHDQLAQKGLHAFLPKVDMWSKRRGVRRLIQAPMFPGYLFLRQAMDKSTYLEVRKTRGLVGVLGERWDRLTAIPDDEMEAIEKLAAARCHVLPFPYLKEGQRARIASGPLAGVEGILLETRAQRGLLVLSVHLLQRSVSVTVDGTDVVPA